MDEPKSIGEVLDQAMLSLLGPDAWDSYCVLCKQTAEVRRQIDAEVRGLFPLFYAEETGKLPNRLSLTAGQMIAARMRAQQRVQQELGRRLCEEEQAFKAKVEALFRWVENRPDCPGCG